MKGELVTNHSLDSAEGSEFVRGQTFSFSKTVGESDVYLFAGITGDLSPNHVNADYMSRTRYGKRVAHGALLVGFMSTCSTKAIESIGDRPCVSYGFDRIRFTNPVHFGDTVTVEYKIADYDPERRITRGEITVTNQDGTLVAVATNLLKFV